MQKSLESKVADEKISASSIKNCTCTSTYVLGVQLHSLIKRNVEFRGSQFSLFIDNRHIETDALGLILG